MLDYTDARNTLSTMNKRQEGGYLTRDLTEVILENNIPRDRFLNTKFFTTLVAVVGKYYENTDDK